jgi:hypothetical protein
MRFFTIFSLTLAAASPALAQDMPLSQILIDGEGWKKVAAPGPKPPEPIIPTHPTTISSDGGTLFVAVPGERFLFAVPARADGSASGPAVPYALLRLKRGEKSIEVTGLATDKDGRIYAATDLGVQVFDPTGRLCGVLTPAAPGKPEHLAFEDDKLTLWIGNTKYERKLNTRGVR